MRNSATPVSKSGQAVADVLRTAITVVTNNGICKDTGHGQTNDQHHACIQYSQAGEH